MKKVMELVQNEIDLMLEAPEYKDDNTFFFKIDKEIEIGHGQFLLIEGKGQQEIKKEYPQTFEDEGCLELFDVTYDVDCELFDENGTILKFNLNK